MNHVHASTLSALVVFADVIVLGFLWRWLAMRLSESSIGKAMAFIY